MKLPTFAESDFAEHSGPTTPLTHFIYHYEPAGTEETALFRARLMALIQWAQTQTPNLELTGGAPTTDAERPA